MAPRRDFVVKNGKMVRRDDRRVIGEKKNGKWQGPHPWNNDETIINCDSPDKLRAIQRSLAISEF